jgi:hypothetical protein
MLQAIAENNRTKARRILSRLSMLTEDARQWLRVLLTGKQDMLHIGMDFAF